MNRSGVLLDTNVASFFVKHSVEARSYARLIRMQSKCLSAVSVAELRYGALKNNWGDSRRSAMEAFINDAVIIPVGKEIASVVAVVMNRREREGRRMDWRDAWIAATAIFHHLPLVTHDSDFVEIEGLELITERRGFQVREPAVVMRTEREVPADAAMGWVRRYVATLEIGLEVAV